MSRAAGLSSWHADWTDLRTFVVGMGVTGFSVADTLWELGAKTLVATASASEEHLAMLDALAIDCTVTDSTDEMVELARTFDPELVIVSPGVRPDHAIVAFATERGIPVWSDIELAWRVRDKVSIADWLVVTGTNGKTVTTQLVAHFLTAANISVAPVGAIGTPVLDAIRDPSGFDVLVVELSSTQLHWLPTVGEGALHPLASVCLNVSEEHLDWHGSAEAYRATKGKVFSNTVRAVLYNRGDAVTEELVREAEVVEGCEAIGFGLLTPDTGELGTIDGILVDRAFVPDRRNTAQELSTLDRLAERGLAAPHLVLDVLAAAGLAIVAGAPAAAIANGLDTFVMEPHCNEVVVERGGVTWVDDSKATNPHATNAALLMFPSIVWIVGGVFAETPIDELVQGHASRIRGVVSIGRDRSEPRRVMAAHAPSIPFVEIDDDDVMGAAVAAASGIAQPGDTVLLSPAAGSMDQFVDFSDRGHKFQDAVHALVGGVDG